jgi:hypothetical protein
MVRSISTVRGDNCLALRFYPPCAFSQPRSLVCGASVVRGPLVGVCILLASCVSEIGRRETRWRRLWFRIVTEGKMVISPVILLRRTVERMAVAIGASPPGTGQIAPPARAAPSLSSLPHLLLQFSLFYFPKPTPVLSRNPSRRQFFYSDPGRFRRSSVARYQHVLVLPSSTSLAHEEEHGRAAPASSSSPSCPPHLQLLQAEVGVGDGGRTSKALPRPWITPPAASLPSSALLLAAVQAGRGQRPGLLHGRGRGANGLGATLHVLESSL